MYKLPQKFPNALRPLKIMKSQKKIFQMLGFYREYLAGQQKDNFYICATKSQKICCRTFNWKYVLLIFVKIYAQLFSVDFSI